MRDVAAEFELRAVMQRLDEEFAEDVPERAVEQTLVMEAVEGTPADLADGRWRSRSPAGPGRRATANGGRGRSAGPRRARRELRGQPLLAHDAKSQGGGAATGLLAVAPAATLELEHDTMVAAYLIDPARRVYELGELAADAGLAARRGAAGAGDEAPRRRAALARPRGRAPPIPPTEARLVFELAAVQREQLERVRARARAQRGRDAADRGARRHGARRRQARHRSAWPRSARAWRSGSTSSSATSTSSPAHEFTIGSPQQLGEVLFEELGLTKKRRGKTGFSTDARVLAQIRDEHEIVAKVESWRELTKLKNTYLDALPDLIDPETGRIHTTFNQVAAATGRLSSTNPNLQNIPIRSEIGRPVRALLRRRARACGCSRPTTTRSSCGSSPTSPARTCCARSSPRGEDVHRETAAEVLGIPPDEVGPAERSKAKMVNYGIAYGLSAFGLADRLQISREEAALYIERYFERFPAVQRFIDETIAKAERDGFVYTLLGRRRAIPELRSGIARRRPSSV